MIKYYTMGFDVTVSPDSTFSLSVQRVATGAAVNITGAEISTYVGIGKKLFLYHNLNDVHLWYPAVPNTTMDPSGWNTTYSFLSALAAALKVKTDAASWATYVDFAVSVTTTGKIKISAHDGTTSLYIQVQNAATQWFLGHTTALNATGTTGREGTYLPKYNVVPTIPYISEVKGPYDSESISSIATPASGNFPYGLSRGYCPRWYDWRQVGEPLSAVDDYITTGVPFGYGFLFDHCRKGNPFILYDDNAYSPICYLRDGKYEPSRMVKDSNDLWGIDFKTIVAGYR